MKYPKTKGNIETKFFYDKDLPQPTPERLEYLRNQVKWLEKQPQPEQRTDAWYKFREGLLTASDWGSILGDNPYSNSTKVLKNKVKDKVYFFSNEACDWGKKYEDVAIQVYEKRNKTKIIEFGCIKHPTIEFLGASPDGITPDGVMVEIKCPFRREITGIPPVYYADQVQGQLEVCELDRCDFLECKLEEVEEEQYFESNYEGDYTMNELNLEKGILSVWLNKKTTDFAFHYGPIGMNREEFEDWKGKQPSRFTDDDNYVFVEYTFWNLLKISNVPIYRDKEWFAKSLIVLRDFWNDVLHYRKLGYKKLIEDLEAKKKKDREGEIFIDTSMINFVKVEKVEKEEDMGCLFSKEDLGLIKKKKSKTSNKIKKTTKKVKKVKPKVKCLFDEVLTSPKKKSPKKVKSKAKKMNKAEKKINNSIKSILDSAF